MKVSREKIPDSQILMTIEVESERLDQARDKAVRKLSPRAKVPGFRPGKAPPAMVRRYFGEERVLDEALDALVPDIYREALASEEDIIPIARPRLVVENVEPLVVKATIPVQPTVDLGDYQAVRVEVEPVVVEESRVDETLDILRRRTATLEPTERQVGWRDVMRIEVSAKVGEETFVQQQEAEIQLAEDRDVLIPGFEEELIGHKKGETVEFDLEVPDSIPDERFSGKQAHFVVQILETKEEILPELDDDFVKNLGQGFESVDALRDRIRDDIRKAEEDRLNDKYHDEILGQLVDQAAIEFPPVMTDAEVDRMLHDQAGHAEHGEAMQQYLASIGKTEEQAREEMKPVADERIRRSLVLSEVAEQEGIDVSDEEIEAEIDRMTASAGPQGAQLAQLFRSEEVRSNVRRNVLTRKTLGRLLEIATEGKIKPEVAPEPQPAPEATAPQEAEPETEETREPEASGAEEE